MGYQETFSEGDLAALRKIYGGKNAHFGIWHSPCQDKRCNDQICYCGSCGLLSGSFSCGFTGYNKTGHWTCCFITNDNNFNCNVRHSGYYHMAHVSLSKCQVGNCVCKSCPGGCMYEGEKGHWSCCLEEDRNKTECKMDPYKTVLLSVQ